MDYSFTFLLQLPPLVFPLTEMGDFYPGISHSYSRRDACCINGASAPVMLSAGR